MKSGKAPFDKNATKDATAVSEKEPIVLSEASFDAFAATLAAAPESPAHKLREAVTEYKRHAPLGLKRRK